MVKFIDSLKFSTFPNVLSLPFWGKQKDFLGSGKSMEIFFVIQFSRLIPGMESIVFFFVSCRENGMLHALKESCDGTESVAIVPGKRCGGWSMIPDGFRYLAAPIKDLHITIE